MRTQAICLALAIIPICPFASAQWVQPSLPDSNGVICFVESGTNLFAGTGSDIFLSTNNGTSWTFDTTIGVCDVHNVFAFAVSETDLFAVGGGVSLSINGGTIWRLVGGMGPAPMSTNE